MIRMLKNKKKNFFPVIYEALIYIYMIFVIISNLCITKFSKTISLPILLDPVVKFSFFVCIVTLIIFIIEKIREKKFNFSSIKIELYLFIAFIIWCFISTLFSTDFKDSFFGICTRYCGFIQFLSFFMFGYLGYSLSPKGRIRFFRFFLLFSFAIAVLTLLSIYDKKYNLLLINTSSNITGIFSNSNHYGYFIVYSIIVSIFLFIYDKNIFLKLIQFLIYLLNLYLLIINNTFGCYIAVLLSIFFLFFYFLKTKVVKKYLYLFIIIPFILLSIFINDNGRYYVKENFNELLTDLNIIVDAPVSEETVEEYNPVWEVGNYRGSLWMHGIKYILERPVFGYGLENLDKRYLKDHIDIGHPHNLIIYLAGSVGIPGMLFYISALIVILIKCIKNIKKDNIIMNLCCFVLIGHLISSMFGVTIYYITVYYIIILGMILKFFVEIDTSNKVKTIS